MYEPHEGETIWVTWADINEEATSDPEKIQVDFRRTKETFMGWRTCEHIGYKVEFLLCWRGDTSLVGDIKLGGIAYPKGCILDIQPYKPVKRPRKKKEPKVES